MSAPVAVITGASSGIGAALAREFARRGFTPVLVARRAERLEALVASLAAAGRTAHALPLDLTLAEAPSVLDDFLAAKALGEPAVLVNNAGIGIAGDFTDCDPAALETMLELNLVVLTRLARHYLPRMRRRSSGRLLNVASVAAFQPGGPGMAAYFASKAYVLSLSRALACELRGSGVTVTALCPGPTRTEFDAVAGAARTRLFTWLPLADASAVARAGVAATLAGRSVSVPGLGNRALAFAGWLSPVALSLAVNRFLLKAPPSPNT
jgi:short-subunit dehydrogenase